MKEKEFNEASLLGQNLNTAVGLANIDGFTLRTMKLNGQELIGTCDFRPNRINVAIENDVVTEILGRG